MVVAKDRVRGVSWIVFVNRGREERLWGVTHDEDSFHWFDWSDWLIGLVH